MQNPQSLAPESQPSGPTMNRNVALVLQGAIVLVGLCALAFLLWEPHVEGRNARATTFEIYFHDPFLAYVYVGSTTFFMALCRAFGLLGHVRRTGAFSQVTLDALRAIKHCAIGLIGFVAGAVVFIVMRAHGEDRPAGVFMCLLVALPASAVAIAATMFARRLRKALGVGVEQGADSRARCFACLKPLGLVALGLAVGAGGIYVGATDDAPGAALIAILFMLVTVTLGVRAAWRSRADTLKPPNP